MALDDIKKEILGNAQKEAERIISEAQAEAGKIRAEWDKKIEERKKEIVVSAQKKADQKIQQNLFKLESQARTEILNQKQKIITRAYETALDKLGDLSEEQYVSLLSSLITQIPEAEGKLISTRGRENELKKALKKSGKKFDVAQETILGRGGFIFRSEQMEINNGFESLIRTIREKTILTVSSLLFNGLDQE